MFRLVGVILLWTAVFNGAAHGQTPVIVQTYCPSASSVATIEPLNLNELAARLKQLGAQQVELKEKLNEVKALQTQAKGQLSSLPTLAAQCKSIGEALQRLEAQSKSIGREMQHLQVHLTTANERLEKMEGDKQSRKDHEVHAGLLKTLEKGQQDTLARLTSVENFFAVFPSNTNSTTPASLFTTERIVCVLGIALAALVVYFAFLSRTGLLRKQIAEVAVERDQERQRADNLDRKLHSTTIERDHAIAEIEQYQVQLATTADKLDRLERRLAETEHEFTSQIETLQTQLTRLCQENEELRRELECRKEEQKPAPSSSCPSTTEQEPPDVPKTTETPFPGSCAAQFKSRVGASSHKVETPIEFVFPAMN